MPLIIQAIEDLIILVQGLSLNNGQKNSLTVNLNGAIDKLAEEDPNIPPACGKMKAFVNQMEAFVQSSTITEAEGQPLIDAANAIRTDLGCFQFEK